MRNASHCWVLLVLAAIVVPAGARADTGQVIAIRDVAADVAIDEDGRAFVVSPSTLPDPRTLASVRARWAAPGAAFGPPRTLMRSTRGDRAVDTGIAADGRGVIVVQSTRRARRSVRVVRFGTHGRVAAPVTISAGAGSADFAASAVARSGAAVVVWFRHRGTRWRLEAATRAPGGAFGAPQPLSAFVRRPCCTGVSVAIGERGDAVAAWRSTSRTGAWAALRRPRRRFGPPQRVAEDPTDVPRAVVGAGGTAALVHGVQHVPRAASDGPQLRRAASGTAFGAAEPVDPGCEPSSGEAAVTPAGRVVVACTAGREGGQGARVHVSEAGPDEPLVATGELGADVTGGRLAIAADDAGRAVVAWPQRARTGRAGRERAVAALRTAHGAPFGAAVALGRASSVAEPGLARLMPGGGALVLWRAARTGARSRHEPALVATRLP